MKKLTIFTPTYNRAGLLPKLYDSLKKQTNKDFIWLIVDDGSKDNTKELVEGFKKENIIEIDYHYKENGGKNTAMDYSHEVCTTDYIACVDSDDLVTEDCVEKLLNIIPISDNYENCVGLLLPKKIINAKNVNYEWNVKDGELIYFSELYGEYGYEGETFLIFKTSIVRNYKFPHCVKSSFLPSDFSPA